VTISGVPAPPMPEVRLQGTWRVVDQHRTRSAVSLTLESSPPISVVLTRCLVSALSEAYPTSSHDVQVEVDGAAHDQLGRLLADLVTAVLTADPDCRRLVLGVQRLELSTIAAAESAGFRYVVDVDIAGEELSLLVAEPDWVTHVDMDLERVPGS
jgi:hypothetical protein